MVYTVADTCLEQWNELG